MSDWRARDDWAQVMEKVLQTLNQSLQRCPELPPPPADPASGQPGSFPALEVVEQRLLQLQAILDQAEGQAGETDRELTAAAEALRQWLGHEPGVRSQESGVRSQKNVFLTPDP